MQFFLRNTSAKYSTLKLFYKELAISSIIVISSFIYPATAHAGFFSDLISQAFIGNASAAPAPTQDTPSQNLQNMPILQAAINLDPNPTLMSDRLVVVSGNSLVPEISPSTTATDLNDEENTLISIYVVRSGDSLAKIAQIFDVSANTIIWANDLGANPILKVGQTLVILPISGVRYTVKKGDTLKGIALRYKADLDEILQYNDLTIASVINQGDELIIPDAEMVTPQTPVKSIASATAGYYIRPIIGGVKTQGIHGHNGIDLASSYGSNILASASGQVIISKNSGWNGGYGKYIVIKHNNGTQTLYSHLSGTAVVVGDYVTKGKVIGYMGNSGRVTGNTGVHLHFEVRGARNPF